MIMHFTFGSTCSAPFRIFAKSFFKNFSRPFLLRTKF